MGVPVRVNTADIYFTVLFLHQYLPGLYVPQSQIALISAAYQVSVIIHKSELYLIIISAFQLLNYSAFLKIYNIYRTVPAVNSCYI